MISLRSLTSAVLAAALFALAGCGGDDENPTPAPVQVDSARTVRATLGLAGGTLVATAADGRRYTLIVPPGALASATEITATPVVSMGSAPLAAGLKGAVRFGPAGLQFALEATLRIEGATQLGAGLRHVGFTRSEDGQIMRLSLPDTSGGALEVPVFHFSDIGVAEATETEVANVPPAPPSQVVFERMHEIMLRERTETDAEAEAVLSLIFAQFVKPALDAGTASSETAVLEKGLLAFDSWRRAFAYLSIAPNPATVNASLARDLTSARQQAAGLLKSLFEADIARCLSDPQDLGFEFAMGLRQKAVQLDLATAEFGLAPADTLRRVNDCVRLIIEPVAFPATVTPGTPRSLDASAKLVFAEAPQALAELNAEFTVTSNDASVATPTGLSDELGRYTVVVTPLIATPDITLRACYVLDPLIGRPGGLTDLCTTVTVPDRTPPPSLSQLGDYKGTLQDLQRGKPPRTPFEAEMTVKGSGGSVVTVTVFRRVFDFFGVEVSPQVLYTGSGTIEADGSLRIGPPDDPEFYGTFSGDSFSGFIDKDGAAESDLEKVEMRRL